MPHMRKVHEHLGQVGEAHRQSHEEALRAAAVARAEAEAAMTAQGEIEASGGPTDDG